MPGAVYICHAQSDAGYVDRLVAQLSAVGLTVRTDRDIPADASAARLIDEHLRASAVVVPVMSPQSRGSEQVASGILLAQRLGRPMMPLLLAGEPFIELLSTPHEDVRDGAVPSADYTSRLRDLANGHTPASASANTDAVAVRRRAASGSGQRERYDSRQRLRRRIAIAAGAIVMLMIAVVAVAVWHVTVHSAPVTAVAWSPDGARVATASIDDTGRIWDVATGEAVLTLRHRGDVGAIAWSPDGTRLATASVDYVRIWDSATGSVVHAFAHSGDVSDVRLAWSWDSNRLIVLAYIPKVWDAVTGQLVRTLRSDDSYGADEMAISPDGARLVTVNTNGDLRVWDLVTGQATSIEASAHMAVWSPDGTRLATADRTKTAQIFSADGRLVGTLAHPSHVNAIAWSPDGEQVVTASMDAARTWDALTGLQVHSFGGPARTAAWSPTGNRVVTVDGSSVRTWDAATGQPLHTFAGHTFAVTSVGWSPDGTKLATGGDDWTARVWDTTTGGLEHVLGRSIWHL